MSHENAALVLNQFKEIYKDTGLAPRVWDPDKVAIIFDHRVPAESSKTASNQKTGSRVRRASRAFANSTIFAATRAASVTRSCPKTAMSVRARWWWARTVTQPAHGALGAFAFGVGATEMASIWALGRVLNVEVPATIKVTSAGNSPQACSPRT